jgi:hypothetical protein
MLKVLSPDQFKQQRREPLLDYKYYLAEAQDLDDWYAASKREPYYDSLKKGSAFRGYWSWEAAAITFLLEIDDFTYANARFNPTDLVQFSRAKDLKISKELQ